ncbi:molybdenum ABC transporter substrate-binding protein [Ktedonobacteria bacterium brp13]|nr:molybdenum ABC transporter substrate-binding protein [Ktedonobacteria bacterium brp13]
MSIFRRVFPFFMVFVVLILAACGNTGTTTTTQSGSGAATKTTTSPVTLNIFAASSLTESFNEIKQQYHTLHSDVTITYNFNGSQALEQQIANGAPSDIFASADQSNMQNASTANLVATSTVFAKNRLVVIVPAANPAHISTLKDLAKPGLKLVVGAPAVPIGKYGLQILDKLGQSSAYGAAYEKSVKANIVSQEENVKAVVEKVQLGEADAGIVYVTDVTQQELSQVTMITIPDQYNVVAQYPIALTKSSTHSQQAQDFINYLLSSAGQTVLTKYHFIAVTNS